MNSSAHSISEVVDPILASGEVLSIDAIYTLVKAHIPMDEEDWAPYDHRPTWQHHVRSWLWSRKRSGAIFQPAPAYYQRVTALLPVSEPPVPGKYRPAKMTPTKATEKPFYRDPNLLDRALTAHVEIQNGLQAFVAGNGAVAWSPSFVEPDFDLAWMYKEVVFVAEVKSLTPFNENRQLRLGLGQVLDYEAVMSQWWPNVRAVLAVEYEPEDQRWIALCRRHSVKLVWPQTFDVLLDIGSDAERVPS